jgi:flavin-dependent dehydrogenase
MRSAIVAGAGPAGSCAALLLARDGLRVTIVERSAFPRSKACGEYLSGATVRALRELGVASSLESQAYALEGVTLYSGGARAEFAFRAPGWALPRSVLDAALLDAARNAGARFIQGHARTLVRVVSGVVLEVGTPSGESLRLSSDVCIGADGAHSIVARSAGLSAERTQSRRRFALGGHYTGVRGLNRRVHMFVDGGAYFAVNPLSETRANVMLIVDEDDLREHRDDLDAYVRERARQLASGAFSFAHAALEGKRIATGPLAYRARTFTAPGILLAGDAAAFIDPFTGQGVYLALFAARCARDAIASGDLSRYERRMQFEIQKRRALGAVVRLATKAPLLAKQAWMFRPLVDAVSA